jgi:hypothetical protein
MSTFPAQISASTAKKRFVTKSQAMMDSVATFLARK